MDPPADLTLPVSGSRTAREILNEYLRSVLRMLLRLPSARFHRLQASEFASTRRVVATLLQDRNPGPIYSALRQPTVSTLVRCIQQELYGGGDTLKLDGWLSELTAHLALELAAAGGLPERGVALSALPDRVLSPVVGVEIDLRHADRLHLESGRVTVEHDGQRETLELGALSAPRGSGSERVRQPFHTIEAGLLLALADNNPLSSFEAHPDKSGNALDLGDATVEEWTRALRAALSTIARYLPDLAAEIRTFLRLLVPVGTSGDQHLSASYAEAIGTAYLTLHPNPMTMAEALIHEFSHNKLNALLALDPVLENDEAERYSSPVRPDPRPLKGILLAVHAFVPVARLYERMAEAGDPLATHDSFNSRHERIVAGNHDGIATLRAQARPTPVGAALLDELARWDAHFGTGEP